MSDQAELLRQLLIQDRKDAEHGDRPVSFANRRGAVLVLGEQAGCRRLGLQLAVGWRRTGIPVAYLEVAADTLASELNVSNRIAWQDVLSGRRTLREAFVTGPSGVDLIVGRPETPRESQVDDDHSQAGPAIRQVRKLATRQRIVIEIAESSHLTHFLPIADHCLFLTSVNEQALVECYARIKSSTHVTNHAVFGVVVENTADARQAKQVATQLAVTADRCLNREVAFWGELPGDDEYAQRQTPALRRDSGSRDYVQAVMQLSQRLDARWMIAPSSALVEV